MSESEQNAYEELRAALHLIRLWAAFDCDGEGRRVTLLPNLTRALCDRALKAARDHLEQRP